MRCKSNTIPGDVSKCNTLPEIYFEIAFVTGAVSGVAVSGLSLSRPAQLH